MRNNEALDAILKELEAAEKEYNEKLTKYNEKNLEEKKDSE